MISHILITSAILYQYIISCIVGLSTHRRLINIIGGIFSFSLYWFAFGGVTDTTDWNGYLYIYENEEFSIDFIFRFLSVQTKLLGLNYIHLYQFHVLLTGALLTFFISRFTSNIFFISTFVILILFIPLANQIRFFLSLSLFLNAIYFLCVKKKKVLFLIIGLVSVLSHIGITPLFLFIPIYFIENNKNYLKTIIIISTSIYILIATLFSLFGTLSELGLRENFDSYFLSDYSSSFLGSLFQSLPILIITTILIANKNYFINKISHFQDEKLYFLYRLTFFSFIFIPASFLTQIVLFRYCIALFFVWVLLILRAAKYEKRNIQIRKISLLFVIQYMYIIYIYWIPISILNSSSTIEKFYSIIDSIKFN